ncbi:VOC family protein [Clostridium scatologenes]|uniref:Lactoylglutathione lyase n=1 Tax=Clostridium scatologenes TaxID=1548 RepID=A0A0E3K1V5_CLOSL|nr:VOC family protein [Clostridium scatologenes]AKA70302.1 lactoylglutathione lyase [Clostridium scatologenes]
MKEFEVLGYSLEGKVIKDIKRNVYIQFLILNGYRLELVAPSTEQAPINGILKKSGEGPYHICYETSSIDNAISELVKEKYVLIENKSGAVAFDNKNIAFLFKKGIGLIELLEM